MERVQQQQVEYTDKQSKIPPLPSWPTSVPGPKVTEPPTGQRRVFRRTEQVVEINYDEQQGKSTARREAQ